MTCSGFGSYGLVNHDSYKSKSLHQMRSKFIGSNRPCLKQEKAIFDIPSLSKKYILCSPILSLVKYFLSKRNPNQDHTPHWGQMRNILETRIKSMDQRKAQNKSPMFEKRLEEENPQIEGHPRKKTLGKAMQKKKMCKENGKERKCLSILREARQFSIEKRQ